MAKRSKPKKKVTGQVSLEFRREIKHLETIIKYSLKAIDGKSEELDKLFLGQVERCTVKLEKLKASR